MQVSKFKNLPKIELHLHLDCSLSYDVVKKIESAINMSGYETMNTTANQESYDALPMCCKYDRNMKVPDSKYQ